MKKLTVCERREKELLRLFDRLHWMGVKFDPSDIRTLINSFYRLNGLLERLLYLDNDDVTCNLKSTIALNEKALKWIERLNNKLKPYDLHIIQYGYLETLETIDGKYTYNAIYYK